MEPAGLGAVRRPRSRRPRPDRARRAPRPEAEDRHRGRPGQPVHRRPRQAEPEHRSPARHGRRLRLGQGDRGEHAAPQQGPGRPDQPAPRGRRQRAQVVRVAADARRHLLRQRPARHRHRRRQPGHRPDLPGAWVCSSRGCTWASVARVAARPSTRVCPTRCSSCPAPWPRASRSPSRSTRSSARAPSRSPASSAGCWSRPVSACPSRTRSRASANASRARTSSGSSWRSRSSVRSVATSPSCSTRWPRRCVSASTSAARSPRWPPKGSSPPGCWAASRRSSCSTFCLTNHDYVIVMFQEPLGWAMLAGAATILAVGVFWMSRLVKVEV